jgi:hypothetical protein
MAQDFQLKLITQRAGGGDPIVRERTAPGPELTVGRAADNAVVLADLSIDPKHAVIRATGPGRVSVESVSGLPFQVGGRSVQRSDLSVANRPVLTFGSYQIALEPGEGENIAVVVTREEEEHALSPSVFSLKAAFFGRRRMAWILGVGIFVVALLTPLLFTGILAPAKIHPDQQWSSGPLSRAHAFMEDDCRSCHQKAFVAVRDDACLSCHKADVDAAGLQRVRDLGSPFRPSGVYDHAAHEKLTKATPLPKDLGDRVQMVVQRTFGRPVQRCASCHIEHTTPAKPPADGSPRPPIPEKPTLVVVQSCEGCHSELKMRLRDTQLIDTPDWNRHPQFRPLVTTGYEGGRPRLQRIAVSSRPQDGSNLTFPHRLHMDPAGGVARLAMNLGPAGGYGAALDCGSCHRPDGRGGFQPLEMERDCKACHSLAFASDGGQLRDLPHGDVPKVIEALNAFYGGPSPAGSGRQRPGGVTYAATPAARSAFNVAFAAGGTCVDCHTVTRTSAGVSVAPVKLQNRFLPRGGFNHAIPEHKGEGRSVLKGTAACADCHAAKTSDRATDFLLPGIAKCGTCHGKTKAQTPAFAPVTCETCHSYHKPGQATPKPGHPKLETFRWTGAAQVPSPS